MQKPGIVVWLPTHPPGFDMCFWEVTYPRSLYFVHLSSLGIHSYSILTYFLIKEPLIKSARLSSSAPLKTL